MWMDELKPERLAPERLFTPEVHKRVAAGLGNPNKAGSIPELPSTFASGALLSQLGLIPRAAL
jgi:hypothetical protein